MIDFFVILMSLAADSPLYYVDDDLKVFLLMELTGKNNGISMFHLELHLYHIFNIFYKQILSETDLI